MRSIWQDVRYGLRQWRRSPGFSLTAIISLALGIGATTAVFSVVYAVLLDPYPYADADRMVHLVVKTKSAQEFWLVFTGPQYQKLRESHAIESAVAQDGWNLTTTGSELPEDVNAAYFTGNGFDHFGVPMFLGRGLKPSDAPEGADPEPVAVLGYKFWQRHYNGERNVIGKTLQLVHKNYTIIGVAHPRFTWGDADVYLPLKVSSDPARAYQVNTKLKPGVSHAAANAEFQSLFEQFAQETPKHFPHESFRVQVKGLNDQFLERIGPTLALLLGSVALLLLIGCGNVSILLLARGTARDHEFAVRAAVGADRVRLIRQLLTESLLLAITGTALGIALAYEAINIIVAMLPGGSFPHESSIHVNLPVLLFSAGLAIFTGVFFGLSPAMQFSRPEVSQVMQSSAKKILGGVRGKRFHRLLISGQIALTLLLLATAGAAIQGFVKLSHSYLGYNPHNVMSVGIPVHDNTYTSWESRSQYFTQLMQKVAAMPEVKMVGLSTNATPPDNGADNIFELQGKPTLEDKHARLNFVSHEYFPVLQIPLLQGRLWNDSETQRGARVAVIDETLAKRYFPGGDAVGHQIRTPNVKADPPITQAIPESGDWFEIIGVVGDVLDDGLGKPIKPEIYVPYTIFMPPWTQILVRTDGPPLAVLDSVRRTVHTVDADQQAAGHVRSLEEWITTQREWSQQRLLATLFGVFAALALSLAAVGLYSVVSYTVAQRTNEFGIRMALGADRLHVLRMVFLSTAGSVCVGVAMGLVLSLAMRRLVAQWAEGSSINVPVLAAVSVLLFAVAIVACAIPARRASVIDPMQALRAE